MASKARRPHGLLLQAQVQQNMQGTLAAHRQHLQQACSSTCSRPPQLPAVGSGYPLGSPDPHAVSAGGARTPSRRASSSSSAARPGSGGTGAGPPLPGASPSGASPAHSRSRRRLRAESLEASSSGARRSPSAASAASGGRLSPREGSGGSSVKLGGAEADEAEAELGLADADDAEEDEDLRQQLEELQELSSRLGIVTEDGGSSGSGALEPRPTTGGTSASTSTTARGGSSVGCATSEDEPGSEAGGEGAAWGRGGEEPEGGVAGWCGAICASYELQQLRLPHGCRLERTAGSAGQYFFTIDVAEGPFTPATLTFWVKIFDDFPGPGSCSVRCTQRIFHPCVDPTTGRIAVPDEVFENCDKALASLLGFVRQLILTPGDSPAANADAALLFQTDPEEFRRTVRFALNGGKHGGVQYDRVLSSGKATKAAANDESVDLQASMSDDIKLSVMRLEVMKDQFKSKASEMQECNNLMISSLS